MRTPRILTIAYVVVVAACGGGGGGSGDGGGDPIAMCKALPKQTWSGSQGNCLVPTPAWEANIDELVTLWDTSPAGICGYSVPPGAISACGPMFAGNAAYCPPDDSIYFDSGFLGALTQGIGDFAAVGVAAHEWGHLNQNRTGLTVDPGQVNITRELHADCQAGVFAAVEEARGRLQQGDMEEAFRAFCAVGDPLGTPWFLPGAHGSCLQRAASFGHGYQTARVSLGTVCGGDALTAMLDICGTY